MHYFNIKVADHVIALETNHILTYASCRDYIVDDNAEFKITVLQEDIEDEKRLYVESHGFCDRWDSYFEFFAVLRKISLALLDYDVLLLHGAALSLDNCGYIFSGSSGVGKSTHIVNWLENRPDTVVINGDKPFVYCNEKKVMVYGSPWAGKECIYTNTKVPLKAIIIMKRGKENSIQKISYLDAFPLLLAETYRPSDSEKMRTVLSLLTTLASHVEFYRFECNNFQDNCFDVVYRAVVQ